MGQFTRRALLLAAPFAAGAQEVLVKPLTFRPLDFNKEIEQGDTAIILMQDPGRADFEVGVRTKVAADEALVQVFYELPGNEASALIGTKVDHLMLHQEHMAPIAGEHAYGAAGPYTVPKERIRLVRIRFFKTVSELEFGR